MLKITNYEKNKDILSFECECGEIVETDLSKIIELNFLKEFDEYENISKKCENCKRIHFLNSNIPISEYEERIAEEIFLPLHEINDRKILRDILWEKRKDLKKLDRTKYNEEKKQLYEKDKEEAEKLKKKIEANEKIRRNRVDN